MMMCYKIQSVFCLRKIMVAIGALALANGLMACHTVKPYQKEHLLNPLMDDKGLGPLNSTFANAALNSKDFLASGSAQASASSSCPTCGG